MLAGLMETIPFDERGRNPRLLRAAAELKRNDVTVLLLKDDAAFGAFPEKVLPRDLHPLARGDVRTISGIKGSTAWAAAIGTPPRPGVHCGGADR